MRIPVHEVENLDYIEYLQVRRDAFITRLNQTEEGRNYLNEAWRLSRTEPDRKASRELFGRKEG